MLKMLSSKKVDVGYKRKKLRRVYNTSSSDAIEMEVESCEGTNLRILKLKNLTLS